MNCLELKQDIENLRAAQEELQKCIDDSNETGERKRELRQAKERADNTANELLKTYLSDFAEQNPEIVRCIPGPNIDCPVERTTIRRIIPLSDDEVLISGDNFAGIYSEENGQLKFKAPLDELSIDEFSPETAAILGNGKSIIGGHNFLAECHKDAAGKYLLSPITLPDLQAIESAVALSENEVLIGTQNGYLYKYSYKNGQWTLEDETPFSDQGHIVAQSPNSILMMNRDAAKTYDNKLLRYEKDQNGNWSSTPSAIELPHTGYYVNISELPNGNIIIVTREMVYEGQKNGSDWIFSELPLSNTVGKSMDRPYEDYDDPSTINDAYNYDYSHVKLEFAAGISDSALLVGGNFDFSYGNGEGWIFEYHKKDGQWKLDSEDYTCGPNDIPASLHELVRLPNGKIMIGGNNGMLREMREIPTIYDLVNNLSTIAAKAPATAAA